jgi:hypothetical protein
MDVNNRKNIVLVGCLQRKKQSPHHSKKRLKLNEQVQNRMFSTLVTKCGGIQLNAHVMYVQKYSMLAMRV